MVVNPDGEIVHTSQIPNARVQTTQIPNSRVQTTQIPHSRIQTTQIPHSNCPQNSLKDPVISEQQTYNCNFCTFKTKGLRKFKNHIRKHSEKQINCSFCEKIFLDRSQLNFHVKLKHAHFEIIEKNVEKDDKYDANVQNVDGNLSSDGKKTSNHVNGTVFRYDQNEADSYQSNHFNRMSNKMEEQMEMSNEKKGDNLTTEVLKNNGGIKEGNWFHSMQNELSTVSHGNNIQTGSNTMEVMNRTGKSSYNKIRTQSYSNLSMKRKGFICNKCGSIFEHPRVYSIHVKRCRKSIFRYICKCKVKFKWKSRFLHHKIQCASCNSLKHGATLKPPPIYMNGIINTPLTNKSGRTFGQIPRYNIGNDLVRQESIDDRSCTENLIQNEKYVLNNTADTCTSEEMDVNLYDESSDLESSEMGENVSTTLKINNKSSSEINNETGIYFNSLHSGEMDASSRIPSNETSSLYSSEMDASSRIPSNETSSLYSGEMVNTQNGEIDHTVSKSRTISNSNDSNFVKPVQDNGDLCIMHDKADNIQRDQNVDKQYNIPKTNCNTSYQLNTDKNYFPVDSIVNGSSLFTQESAGNSESGVGIDLSCVKQEPSETEDHISKLLQKGEQLSVEKLFEETSCGDLRNVQYRKSDMDFQTVLNSLANSSGFLNYAMEDCDANLKCEECGEIFKRKAYLKEHMEGKHGGDLRYSCDCGKKFKWRSSLGSHRKNCYQALLSVLPQEGQSPGQNVSVIDFSQSGIPYMNMQNEWLKEIEKMTQSSLLQNKDSSMHFNQGSSQRHLANPVMCENQNMKLTQRRKSDSICQSEKTLNQNSALRIDTTLVKPFADALSKYKQKPAINDFSNREESKLKFYDNCDTPYKATAKRSTKNCPDDRSNGVVDLRRENNFSNFNRQIISNFQNAEYDHQQNISEENAISGITENESYIAEKDRTMARARLSAFSAGKQALPQQRRKSLPFTNNEALDCTFCREKFFNEDELERHKLFCKHLQDTCSVCGKTFQHRTDLVHHLLTFHGSDESYSCFCGLTSSDWNSFEKHCEKCVDFKTHSISFSSSPRSKKQRSESRSFSNERYHAENVAQNQQTLNPRLETWLPTTNQHFKMETFLPNREIYSSVSAKQHLHAESIPSSQEVNPKVVSRSSSNLHGYMENSAKIYGTDVHKQNNHVMQVLPETSTKSLPTISSFVTPSAENSGVQQFTTSMIQSKQSHSTVGEIINQSKCIKEEVVNKDVFVCKFCGNVYNSLEKFSEHNKIHHVGKILSPDRNKKVDNAVDIAIDKARHLALKIPEHVCHLCGDVFAAKAYLKEHISGKHGTVDRYECPCGMRFKWRSSLGIHQKRCPKSNKRTYSRWNSS
jgi:hypothetical protein